MKRLLPVLLISFLSNFAFGLEISILTCSPGEDLYSVFGHSAIRVQSPETGHDWVYNYGTFDFNTEDFYMKFARGKLDYMLSRQAFANFQFEYLRENRSIMEQKLLLSDEQLKNLHNLLEDNYKPENRFYKYDFFFDNCATRVWDIVDAACGKGLSVGQPQDTLATFRETVEHNLRFMPWAKIGISLALGAPYDQKMEPGQETFLPDYLMRRFAAAQLDGKNLTAEPVELLNREDFEQKSSSLPLLISLLMVFGFGWIFVRKKQKLMQLAGGFLFWLFSIVGVLLLLLWFATDHIATKLNPDLLWTFPFAFFLLIGKFKRPVHMIALAFSIAGLVYFTLIIPASLGTKLFFIPLVVCLILYHFSMLRPKS